MNVTVCCRPMVSVRLTPCFSLSRSLSATIRELLISSTLHTSDRQKSGLSLLPAMRTITPAGFNSAACGSMVANHIGSDLSETICISRILPSSATIVIMTTVDHDLPSSLRYCVPQSIPKDSHTRLPLTSTSPATDRTLAPLGEEGDALPSAKGLRQVETLSAVSRQDFLDAWPSARGVGSTDTLFAVRHHSPHCGEWRYLRPAYSWVHHRPASTVAASRLAVRLPRPRRRSTPDRPRSSNPRTSRQTAHRHRAQDTPPTSG